jgi:hypothetical protein
VYLARAVVAKVTTERLVVAVNIARVVRIADAAKIVGIVGLLGAVRI